MQKKQLCEKNTMWMKILVNNQEKKRTEKFNTKWLPKFSKSKFTVPLKHS